MGDCCVVKATTPTSPTRCPECGRQGRLVQRITVKAMLRPTALMRRSAPEHRFCSTARCRVVYFGTGEVLDREEIVVPVFQKEPQGDRMVCYCFAVTEGDIRREVAETGRAEAVERITALVRAERCACEVKNPQGGCCLGNLATATAVVKAALRNEHSQASVETPCRSEALAAEPQASASAHAEPSSPSPGRSRTLLTS